MHRDWWGLSRDTRVSFLSLFLFFARSFSPIGRSSLLCLYPTGCRTRFFPFFPSFLIPRVCFFFTFHIFVNRTVGVSSGKKLTLFFLVSCPVSLPISSPFKLKKITYDRSTFVNPPISIQTRYRSLSYKRNGCPIVSKRFSLSLSLSPPPRSLLSSPPCCHTRGHIWLGAHVDDPQRSSTSSLSRRSANRRIRAIERGEGQGITHGTRVHLRRQLRRRRRHVPHDPLPRINSLDPLSAPTTPSVFPSSSLLFFPPPPSPPSPTDSPPPLLRRPLRPAASLAPTLSPSLSLSFLSYLLFSSLPALCVSLSSRTHLPAERGRTCSTVALRPKVLLRYSLPRSRSILHPDHPKA